MATYEPAPISTDGVELPSSLSELIERLSESNHDHWARQRIDAGWTYGPERNDELRTHPDLVPYGALDDAEKEYDRTSVIETLRAIVALGYRIEHGPREED